MIQKLLLTSVYADLSVSNAPIEGNVFGNMGLSELFTMVVNLLIMVGLGLVLVFLALGFIKFITSQGDKIATEQAQKWITYTIIGGVGLFAVFAIKELILNLVGASDPLG